MTAVLWSPDAPNRCACDGIYQPWLVRGRLVKRVEPAWSMAESRTPECLQEQMRLLTPVYGCCYQHHNRSDDSGAGYPDCHIWAAGRGSMWLELKRMGKNPTRVQCAVMESLLAAPHPVYLVRPCCLLSGGVDEILAEFSGRACRYGRGQPRAAVAADRPSRRVAAPSRPRLPGGEPTPFGPATGYVIPCPKGQTAGDAMLVLEGWLRGAGFMPAHYPYPIRLVVGGLDVLVHCRLGLARPGVDERVWRAGQAMTPC